MYFVARKLYCSQNPPLEMWVAELKEGEVVSLFPFDGERQSMLWYEELFLSATKDARCYGDIRKETALCEKMGQSLFLYTTIVPLNGTPTDETSLVLLE